MNPDGRMKRPQHGDTVIMVSWQARQALLDAKLCAEGIKCAVVLGYCILKPVEQDPSTKSYIWANFCSFFFFRAPANCWLSFSFPSTTPPKMTRICSSEAETRPPTPRTPPSPCGQAGTWANFSKAASRLSKQATVDGTGAEL